MHVFLIEETEEFLRWCAQTPEGHKHAMDVWGGETRYYLDAFRRATS